MPELMDLIVRATNAVISVISTLGMVIYTFFAVTLAAKAVFDLRMVLDRHGWHNWTWKTMYIARIVLFIAGIVLMTMYIL